MSTRTLIVNCQIIGHYHFLIHEQHMLAIQFRLVKISSVVLMKEISLTMASEKIIPKQLRSKLGNIRCSRVLPNNHTELSNCEFVRRETKFWYRDNYSTSTQYLFKKQNDSPCNAYLRRCYSGPASGAAVNAKGSREKCISARRSR